MEDHVKYFLCECGTEGIRVEVEKDPKFGNEVYLALYAICPYSFRFSFLERLKLMWKVFTMGTAYEDQVILNFDKALQLADFLKKEIERVEVLRNIELTVPEDDISFVDPRRIDDTGTVLEDL